MQTYLVNTHSYFTKKSWNAQLYTECHQNEIEEDINDLSILIVQM